MNTSLFAQKLVAWFTVNQRDLPWRHTHDPYKIWISEIMLQQTTVQTVIPYYCRWIRKFPTVRHLARAQIKTVLTYWQGLGYYQRAKNLHASAKTIVKEFAGQIPEDRKALLTLRGFGPYTTGAVLSIAFGKKEVIIDANVRRVMMRILALRGHASPVHDKRIEIFLKRVIPDGEMSAFNQGLMELGALVCQSHQTSCHKCPLREYCKAYEQGIQEIIPNKKIKKIKTKNVCVAILEHRKRFFIQKRSSKGLLADLWEFPGGQREKGETLRQTLARELREELGIELRSAKLFFRTKHFYTEFRVNLFAFKCTVDPWPKESPDKKWITLKAFDRYPMPSGTCKIVAHIRNKSKE